MALFDNLKTDSSVESDGDVIATSMYAPVPSGVYPGVIELAYLDKSKGGATSLNLVFKVQNDKEIRKQLWITSGDAKGNSNTYVDKKTGAKKYLPDFTLGNDISLLAAGEELAVVANAAEKKVISLYNYELKKEAPIEKDVVVGLIGKEVTLGIFLQTNSKTAFNQATGSYEPTGETYEGNDVVKAFRTRDGLTVTEILNGVTEAVFIESWSDKFTGQLQDKTVKGGNTSTSTPSGGTGAAKPKSSLFG